MRKTQKLCVSRLRYDSNKMCASPEPIQTTINGSRNRCSMLVQNFLTDAAVKLAAEAEGDCSIVRVPNAMVRHENIHAHVYCSKMRRMGGAVRNDSLRGSPGSNESATLIMSS